MLPRTTWRKHNPNNLNLTIYFASDKVCFWFFVEGNTDKLKYVLSYFIDFYIIKTRVVF